MDGSELHLADLHRRARELGVPRYRLLTRDQLIGAIDESERVGGLPSAEPAEAPDRAAADREGAAPEAGEDTEQVTGVLDRMPQGYGFLRLGGAEEAEGDVYLSASQIRRCELRPGDEVSGPARPPRRGERHRALVRVETVNGKSPDSEREVFEDMTPAPPHRRLLAPDASADPLVRAVDLLGPLAFGQRVLVVAQPRSGRTTLLRALGSLVAESGAHLCVLLADERPEEVPRWQSALPSAEIFAATADQEPRDQVHEAELAIGHAKRLAEGGEDVVALIDSLSRLALGYRDPARVKRMFGAGRQLGEDQGGSLTVVATVLDSDDRGAEVRQALETTENLLLHLDAGLAARGLMPALVSQESRASGEEELREPDELEGARRLRDRLSGLDPADAARELSERIAATESNAELLARL